MKIKHLLTKTLLVAAGLLVVQSAWGRRQNCHQVNVSILYMQT